MGVAIPNFRTLHYRLTKEEINLEDLPQIENLQDDFVIVLERAGLKVTNGCSIAKIISPLVSQRKLNKI